MKLLERVVGEHIGVRTVCDLQHERVTTTDRARGRRHQLTVQDGFFVCRHFLRIDAMAERCVDDDGHVLVAVLREQRAHCFVELLQTRRGASFGRDVRTIHNDMV